jgi:hypothetical protein
LTGTLALLLAVAATRRSNEEAVTVFRVRERGGITLIPEQGAAFCITQFRVAAIPQSHHVY